MNKKELALKILEKCIDINEKSGKAVCFFNYCPHTETVCVTVHKLGWTTDLSVDFGLSYGLKNETVTQLFENDWALRKNDIFNELDELEASYEPERKV